MFKLFRRKNKGVVLPGVLERMVNIVDHNQRKAATYLNDKVSIFSARQLKIGLILFCLVFGSGAVYITWQAIYQPGRTFSVKPIEQPKHVILPKDNRQKEAILGAAELQSIRKFQLYLDSLKQTVAGKIIYDSILRHRPGLVDSLAVIEQLYNEQLKTK